MSKFDSGTSKHDSTSPAFGSVVVGVVHENHFLHARLNDHFGTVLTREKRHIDGGTLDIGTPFVEDRIDFGMADKKVLIVKTIRVRPRPRQQIVRTTGRKAVIAQTNDPLFLVNNASTYLSIGVLRSLSSQERHGHTETNVQKESETEQRVQLGKTTQANASRDLQIVLP